MWLIQLNEDGQPVGHAVTYENFKQLHPNVSLPFPLKPEYIEPFGFGMFEWTQFPEHAVFEVAEEVAPQQGGGSIWYQSWAIRDMSDEERAARTEQEWENVRASRNARLSVCDWTQLPDSPLTNVEAANWAVYRQALRDITVQTDPFNIVWPREP